MGKKKIKVEQAQADTDTKQVTFSKRRMGVFKKASKLATLCNAEVGVVVCSPGDVPYTFGKPNFDLIADRFKNGPQEPGSGEASSGHRRGDTTWQLTKMFERLNSIIKKAEVEKKEGEALQKRLESADEERFNKPIEELSLEELKELEAKMMKTHVRIQDNIEKMQASSSLVFLSKDY